jgi:hypothetical protein
MVCYQTNTAENYCKWPKSKEGVNFFETPMVKYQLDAILSINNNASHAAANYLALHSYGLKQQENHGVLHL